MNWNTRELLGACLRSLRDHPPSEPYEVLVADNASADGSAEMVAAEHPWVTLVQTGANLGFAGGNNVLMRRARGRYFLLLNPDTEIVPRLAARPIDTLASHLDGAPRAGAVSARLVQPDGRTQLSCRGFPRPWSLVWEWSGLAKLWPRRLGSYRLRGFDHETAATVDQPMASCLLVRRRALVEVGLFDERFPIFFNDVDLAWRLHRAGWQLDYEPAASILHHGGGTTRLVRRPMIVESGDSLLAFYEKHYRSELGSLGYWLATTAIRASFAARLAANDLRASAGRAKI